jgi:hypothetical protein
MPVRIQDIHFGCEVETVGRTREVVARAIQSIVGGDVIHMGTPTVYDPWECRDTAGRIWKVVSDSSLNNVPADLRAEVVSPVLTYDDISLFQEVVRAVHKAGAHVDEKAGVHCHVSHPDVTPKAIANLCKMVWKQEELIYAALGVTKERMERYCRPLSPTFIERITKTPPRTFQQLNRQWYGKYEPNPQRYSPTRYCLVNVNGWFVRSAIEFRAYAGSLHAGKIKAAILFSMALLARAINAYGASARKRTYDPNSAKYDMRVFLISALGMNGDEFKTARKHLLALMPGDSASKYGKTQRQKKRAVTKIEETAGAGAEMLRPLS